MRAVGDNYRTIHSLQQSVLKTNSEEEGHHENVVTVGEISSRNDSKYTVCAYSHDAHASQAICVILCSAYSTEVIQIQ